jgi:adenosylhomocysteine nucleosidase
MKTIVLVSADGEWRVVRSLLEAPEPETTPMGEYLEATLDGRRVGMFHGGWGKVSAAATAQYVIDTMRPDLLVNLGTCGGFARRIERGTIIQERTIIYDIIEQMAGAAEAIGTTRRRWTHWLPRTCRLPCPRPACLRRPGYRH